LTHPLKISQEIENLLFRYEEEMNIEKIAKFHIEFEQIHPFADGNGRIGRLLMAFQFIQNDLIPPLILNEMRNEYLQSLQDYKQLSIFLFDSQKESCKLFEDLI